MQRSRWLVFGQLSGERRLRHVDIIGGGSVTVCSVAFVTRWQLDVPAERAHRHDGAERLSGAHVQRVVKRDHSKATRSEIPSVRWTPYERVQWSARGPALEVILCSAVVPDEVRIVCDVWEGTRRFVSMLPMEHRT